MNALAGTATGGGSSRTLALDQFVDKQGGSRIIVQDAQWCTDRCRRALRPISLCRDILRAKPDVVLFRYPGFPFFWSLDRGTDLVRSTLFLLALRRLTQRKKVCVVVDVLDLLRFPSPNPDLQLGLDDRGLERFERMLFGYADGIWACSHAIGDHLATVYDIPEDRVQVVLNGSFRESAGVPGGNDHTDYGKFSFFYAGDLAQGWRGTEIMLDGFVNGVKDRSARLVLCGTGGEWIARSVSDERIMNLGVLTAQEAAMAGRNCSVGLIPQPESGYYHMAFPTKLGLYITLGLPVITTCAREAASFVRANGLGLVAPAGDFGTHMQRLMDDVPLFRTCQAAARSMSEAFYWDSIYPAALSQFVERCSLPCDGFPDD